MPNLLGEDMDKADTSFVLPDGTRSRTTQFTETPVQLALAIWHQSYNAIEALAAKSDTGIKST